MVDADMLAMALKRRKLVHETVLLSSLSAPVRCLILSFCSHVDDASSRRVNRVANTVSRNNPNGKRQRDIEQAKRGEALLNRFSLLLDRNEVGYLLLSMRPETTVEEARAQLRMYSLREEAKRPGAIISYLAGQLDDFMETVLNDLLKADLVDIRQAQTGKLTQILGAQPVKRLRKDIAGTIVEMEHRLEFLGLWKSRTKRFVKKNAVPAWRQRESEKVEVKVAPPPLPALSRPTLPDRIRAMHESDMRFLQDAALSHWPRWRQFDVVQFPGLGRATVMDLSRLCAHFVMTIRDAWGRQYDVHPSVVRQEFVLPLVHWSPTVPLPPAVDRLADYKAVGTAVVPGTRCDLNVWDADGLWTRNLPVTVVSNTDDMLTVKRDSGMAMTLKPCERFSVLAKETTWSVDVGQGCATVGIAALLSAVASGNALAALAKPAQDRAVFKADAVLE